MSTKPIDPTHLSAEDARPAPLQRSYTGEGGSLLSSPLRTDSNTSTNSLPASTSRSKRLHDMLPNRSSTHLSSLNPLQKHKRKESSKESGGSAESGSSANGASNPSMSLNGGANPNSTAKIDATSHPIKAGASALLHGLVPKSSGSSHGIGHSRSASALERIAAKTPGLRNTPLASTTASPQQSVANVDSLIAEEDPVLKQQEKPVRVEDVLRERQKNKVRMGEVRDAYMAVDQRARTAESRLDDVFGELQGKIRILRGTIGELQSLVGDVTALQEKFGRESGEVEAEYKAKVAVFEEFKTQSSTIDECGSRIEKGREQVKLANKRLEIARVRVEEWEKREEEWQQKTSKRLRAGWISGLMILSLVLVVLATRKFLLAKHKPSVGLDALQELLENAALPSIAVEDLNDVFSSRIKQLSNTASTIQSISLQPDSRTRLLDEL